LTDLLFVDTLNPMSTQHKLDAITYALNVINDPKATQVRRDRFALAMLRSGTKRIQLAQAAAKAAVEDDDMFAIRKTPKTTSTIDTTIDILSQLAPWSDAA
jgi:hypothetical protein